MKINKTIRIYGAVSRIPIKKFIGLKYNLILYKKIILKRSNQLNAYI